MKPVSLTLNTTCPVCRPAGEAEAELKAFSPYYKKQYSTACFCQFEDDLEQHKEKMTQLLKQRVRVSAIQLNQRLHTHSLKQAEPVRRFGYRLHQYALLKVWLTKRKDHNLQENKGSCLYILTEYRNMFFEFLSTPPPSSGSVFIYLLYLLIYFFTYGGPNPLCRT